MTATLQEPGSRTGRRDGPAVLVAPDYAQGSRARRGERLDHVFAERVDWMRTYGRADHLAVDAGEVTLTFGELEERANQLARHLLAAGARPGDRIALLFDQAVHSYVAMLAVLKINAAYVPLDVGFPADRIAYIIEDAKVQLVLSLSHVPERVEGLEQFAPRVLYVDREAGTIAAYSAARLVAAERGAPVEDLAYLIYTSGTTGKPKGVAIEHTSICNFVRVAAEVYGIRQQDRVYQGMTIAFDFSVEEIWVPWVAGATLVPRPAGSSLLGLDLHAFLVERKVTALCCVPTLLATIEEDLPELRFLLVSGEACPQDLITRWHRPGRRFLNVYGPTEATVTATWTELHPDRPVTIGQPLPTYTTVILDPENPFHALPHGEVGEIGIAGIGLATGYLNRKDLTDKAFIPDFLGIAGNPSGRIYRTGDLGRVNAKCEIEYLGRIDLQVKIRGYRIELTEIESVLLQVPGVAAAVVDTFEPVEGQKELVGYYSVRAGTGTLGQNMITAHLREQLPPYMVPAYLEQLDAIPMTAQDKVDRRALPAPTSRRAGGSAGEHVAPATETERVLAEALAKSLGVDKVSVESHFFDDLGANSLLLTQFSARIRKETSLTAPSIREIYQHPTIRKLAPTVGGEPVPAAAQAAFEQPVPKGSAVKHFLFGTAQLLTFLGVAFVTGWLLEFGLRFTTAIVDPAQIALRSAAYAAVLFLAACVLPILGKWVLVGRWSPREITLWGVGHFRFWIVQMLIRGNPLARLAGSPLYPLYLRLLGAKIGKNVTILSGFVPVATDLITVGADTIVRKECAFNGYRAVAGKLQLGRVTLGRDVYVGEKTVLDIGTSIGDGGQLGHASSLHEGQQIPAGESWHGVPAEPTTTSYRGLESTRSSTLRRFTYGFVQFLGAMVVSPIVFAATMLLLIYVVLPFVPDVLSVGHTSYLGAPINYAILAAIAGVIVLGGLFLTLLTVIVVPRILNVFIKPGQVYNLYGVRYAIMRTIARTSNNPFLVKLFGDSSAITSYFSSIGYDLGNVVQTGSNFGTSMTQDNPLLTTIGSGTMVSDDLVMLNTDYSSTSFRSSPTVVGENNFFGNVIAFPSDAKVGTNVLFGSKVMVPIDGPVRENTGLLGSPCFEIPRTVERDKKFDHLKDPAVTRGLLRRKNRHNALSMAMLMFVRFLQVYVALLVTLAAADLYKLLGVYAVAAMTLVSLVSTVLISVLADRMSMLFRQLEPKYCAILDPYFWRHERLWKLQTPAPFRGTVFNPMIWRMLGVRIGKRLFDDGMWVTERTLTSIGDDVVFNAESGVQCHSLEDGTFKSDFTQVGSGVVIGAAAFVQYGVTIGNGAVIDLDSFLMKGETVSPFTKWQGNPAAEVRVKAETAAPAKAVSTAVAPQQAAAAPAPVRPVAPAPVRPAVAPALPRLALAPHPTFASRPAAAPAPVRQAVAPRPAAPQPLFAAPAPARPVAPRPAVAPRPMVGRPAVAPRPAAGPRPMAAPRPAPAVRPAPAPRPGPLAPARPVDNAPARPVAPVVPLRRPATPTAPGPRAVAPVRPGTEPRLPAVAGPVGTTLRTVGRRPTTSVPSRPDVTTARPAATRIPPTGAAEPTVRLQLAPTRPGAAPAAAGGTEPAVNPQAVGRPATTEPIVTASYPLSA